MVASCDNDLINVLEFFTFNSSGFDKRKIEFDRDIAVKKSVSEDGGYEFLLMLVEFAGQIRREDRFKL